MQTLEPIVANLPLFAGMNEEHLALIAGCAANVRFEAGDYVGRIGEPADHFWVIREGSVSLELNSPERGPRVIQTVRDGDVLGWSWLVAPHQWRFDARATTPVRALVFDGRCLRGKFVTDPVLGYELMRRFAQVIAERLEATGLQLLDIYGDVD